MEQKLRWDRYSGSYLKAGEMEILVLLFLAVLVGIAMAARMAAERTAREERSRVRIPVRIEESEPRRHDLY